MANVPTFSRGEALSAEKLNQLAEAVSVSTSAATPNTSASLPARNFHRPVPLLTIEGSAAYLSPAMGLPVPDGSTAAEVSGLWVVRPGVGGLTNNPPLAAVQQLFAQTAPADGQQLVQKITTAPDGRPITSSLLLLGALEGMPSPVLWDSDTLREGVIYRRVGTVRPHPYHPADSTSLPVGERWVVIAHNDWLLPLVTMSAPGSGYSLISSTSGNSVQLRKLVAGDGVSISANDARSLTISATGGGSYSPAVLGVVDSSGNTVKWADIPDTSPGLELQTPYSYQDGLYVQRTAAGYLKFTLMGF